MKKTLHIITCIVAGLSLAACGASSNGGTTPNNVASITSNVLQFAVGTANYAGTTSLNVVTTYRQPSNGFAPGDSGTLLSSPTITLPAAISNALTAPGSASYDPLATAPYGASTSEVGNDAITSSSQNANASAVTSFGQSGGVFALGIEPWNAMGSGTVTKLGLNPANDGLPFQVAPYPVPLYDVSASPTVTLPQCAAPCTGTDPNTFVPWGGPPAYVMAGSGGVSIVGNGNYLSGSAGVGEGIDVFDGLAPVPGTYTLVVGVPTNSGATTTQTATFALPAMKVLPLPANPTYIPDGSGGGSFTTLAMPAGATEAIVEVIDYGPAGATAAGTQNPGCNGAGDGLPNKYSPTGADPRPIYYTLETSTGTLANLGDAIGPSGSPSICTAAENASATSANTPPTSTGDRYVIQVVAFDYPAYEINPLNSTKNPSPTILGSAGSDDLSISAAGCFADSRGGVQTSCTASLPLLRGRYDQGALSRIH